MKTFKQFVEEAPVNNAGSGNVKGIAPGESPPVRGPIIKRRSIHKDLLKMMIGAMTTPNKKSEIDTKV